MRPFRKRNVDDKSIRGRRTAMTLTEVIVSLTLSTMLLVPMISLMQSSYKIWGHFNSQHRSGADRAIATDYVLRVLGEATEVVSLSNSQLRFKNAAGLVETLRQTGQQLVYDHAGRSDVIANGVGAVRFTRLQNSAEPIEGALIRVEISNGTDAANRSRLGDVWIRRPI